MKPDDDKNEEVVYIYTEIYVCVCIYINTQTWQKLNLCLSIITSITVGFLATDDVFCDSLVQQGTYILRESFCKQTYPCCIDALTCNSSSVHLLTCTLSFIDCKRNQTRYHSIKLCLLIHIDIQR